MKKKYIKTRCECLVEKNGVTKKCNRNKTKLFKYVNTLNVRGWYLCNEHAIKLGLLKPTKDK